MFAVHKRNLSNMPTSFDLTYNVTGLCKDVFIMQVPSDMSHCSSKCIHIANVDIFLNMHAAVDMHSLHICLKVNVYILMFFLPFF